MGTSLEGLVLDLRREPRPEVAVSVRQAPTSVPDLSVLTDGSGRFTLHDLPPGEYVLYFMPPEGEGQALPVSLSGDSVQQEFLLGS